jgi:rod shape-determining protein MreC
MLRRQHYLALGLIALLALVLLNLPQSAAARLKLAFGGFFLPLFGLSSASQALGQKAVDTGVPRALLLHQLGELQRTNQQLRLQTVQLQEAARENARLRQQLLWQQRTPWKLRPARVISRDPANWWRTFQIDLGTRHGITNDTPVLVVEGLVGRVQQAGYTHSQIALVGDPACRVAVLIQETREQGIIVPGAMTASDPMTADLVYLPANSTVKAGHNLVTSGLGGVFPKGIPVGVVTEYQPSDGDLHTTARVRLAVNTGRLEEVWVIAP